MQHDTISRRTFGRFLGAGAVLAAVPAVARPRTRETVRLSANENPYGPSLKAMQAMAGSLHTAARYPDELLDTLAEDLAHLHGVPRESILLGNGSSDILRIASAAFVKRRLTMADPAFEAIGMYAADSGHEVVRVPLDGAYAHDLAKMGDADLVYVCNPNNPTGTITPKAALRSFIAGVPASTIVLVDEAYHHYTQSADYESVIPLVAKYPNLIVARTFSKIYAMAGLRCGYAVAQPATIERMSHHQQWDALNVVALTGAHVSLHDADHVADGKKKNAQVRQWLSDELRKTGHRHLPSDTNFMMIELGRNARPVIAAMRDRGVRVGRLFPAMPQHMRVTIGTPAEMEAFIAAFREVMKSAAVA